MNRRRLPLLAVVSGAAILGLCSSISACGDSDNPPMARREPDARVVTPNLPDTGAPVERESSTFDARALFPEPWDRSVSARDASLEASDKYCNPNDQGVGQFCWDFTFDDGITGWNEVLADGGAHALVGTPGAPERALESTIQSDAGPGRWVSLKYTINIDDIPDAAAGVSVSFSFRASAVASAATIGGLQIGTPKGPVIRGLAIYPTCGTPGIPCVGESAYEGTDLAGRRPFDTKQWYRARIHFQPSFSAGGVVWASTMTVGSTTVAQHDSEALPMTNAFPTSVNLFVGAFDTTKAGRTVVEIDDVYVE